jgi:hypothetical protein
LDQVPPRDRLRLQAERQSLLLACADQSRRDALISQDGHAIQSRDHLSEERELLGGLLRIEARHASDVSARLL